MRLFKKKNYMNSKIFNIFLIALLFSIPVGAVKTEPFFLENNTGLNFMDGTYKIEVIEMSKPIEYYHFVIVNLTTEGLTKQYYLRENENPSINNEPFNKINLNYSYISQTIAKITVEYPDTWLYPKKYNIENAVVVVPDKYQTSY